MREFFSSYYTGEAFTLFSVPHNAALLTIFLINLIIYLFRNKLRHRASCKGIRILFSIILIVEELSLMLWYIMEDRWSLAESLPLHLCSISAFLCAFALLSRNYFLYEIVYFWGLAGTLQALVTPDMGDYSYPHYLYYQYFISHGGIVTACLFMTFVEGYRPRLISIPKTLVVTNLYMLVVGIINSLTGGNYLYICHKPSCPTVFDYLGPWPWYILNLELLALALMFICYLPFGISSCFHRGRVALNCMNSRWMPQRFLLKPSIYKNRRRS